MVRSSIITLLQIYYWKSVGIWWSYDS